MPRFLFLIILCFLLSSCSSSDRVFCSKRCKKLEKSGSFVLQGAVFSTRNDHANNSPYMTTINKQSVCVCTFAVVLDPALPAEKAK